jgi:hypothetical protein
MRGLAEHSRNGRAAPRYDSTERIEVRPRAFQQRAFDAACSFVVASFFRFTAVDGLFAVTFAAALAFELSMA